MEKFSKFQIATLKRTAQNVNPIVTKKKKIQEKIKGLNEEYNSLCEQQEAWESAIKEMTGGYTTEDLVIKVTENNSDKNGNTVKVTKYILKYPDTVVPTIPEVVSEVPEENPSSQELNNLFAEENQ